MQPPPLLLRATGAFAPSSAPPPAARTPLRYAACPRSRAPSRAAAAVRRRVVTATGAEPRALSPPDGGGGGGSSGSGRGSGRGSGSGSGSDSGSNSRSRSQRRVSVVGLLFLFVTYLWSLVLFVPMVLAHPLVLWRDRATRRFHDFIAMAWMKWSLATACVSTRVVNAHLLPPPHQPAVFVANHTSYLDIYVFAYLRRRIKYVSKAEIFRIPIVGWAMAMAGNIALRRMDRRGQIEAYRKMVDVIANGLSLVIFPEGTRSLTGKLRRFKAGAFRAAKANNVPVVPVTILGTREAMPSYAWVPLRHPNKPFSLVVHPPLDSSSLSVQQLQQRAFEAIDSALPLDVQTFPTHTPQ